MIDSTYWAHNGKYQDLYDAVNMLMPDSGEVVNKAKNKNLEKLRKAANVYYDAYNNGLFNRARQCSALFGGATTSQIKRNDPCGWDQLESAIDQIILDAYNEQSNLGNIK